MMTRIATGRRGFFWSIFAACSAAYCSLFRETSSPNHPFDIAAPNWFDRQAMQQSIIPYPDDPTERMKLLLVDSKHNAAMARVHFQAGDYAAVERVARDQELLMWELLHARNDRDRAEGKLDPMDMEQSLKQAHWCEDIADWNQEMIDRTSWREKP